ncbi:hypothetical protein [Ligilactobacillus acidipiscis]|uniref:hypothetical protein n=1 Tax=Ligilactobacillus acidipiscis TaxID=89059 RepID=UPI0023F87DB0|nr:hypothetical protein [Ligilactobacillus acidipiscis]WEV56391.1 hypothetical protein OZX66_09175 [Ligilactobacillus acidipiscis]
MSKSIFKATKEEADNIVKLKDIPINETAYRGMNLARKILLLLLGFFFIGLNAYIMGVEMFPALRGDNNPNFNFIGKVSNSLKGLIEVLIFIWLLYLIINLIPKKNYSVHSLYLFSFMPVGLAAFLVIFFEIVYAVSVVNLGVWATIVIVFLGIIYIFRGLKNKYVDLYGKLYVKGSFRSERKDYFNFLTFFLVIAIFINTFTFKVGIKVEYNFFSIILSFLLLVWFWVISLETKYVFKLFLVNYYFHKYGLYYKEKFKICDSEWYGSRKAKRLAKKKRK